MVDPFSYRAAITCPALVVLGANDPYWAVDAMTLYWRRLTMPKWLSITPNAGHGLGDGERVLGALSVFARACVGEAPLPRLNWSFRPTQSSVRMTLSASAPFKAAVWVAHSRTFHFDAADWRVVATLDGSTKGAQFVLPKSKLNRAAFAELLFSVGGRTVRLCTEVALTPAR
jgi:PhoPQ-activated pathogenicity-related protein